MAWSASTSTSSRRWRDIGFLNPAAPRQLMTRLRRLFNRVRMDQMELNILRGILTEIGKIRAAAGREGL